MGLWRATLHAGYGIAVESISYLAAGASVLHIKSNRFLGEVFEKTRSNKIQVLSNIRNSTDCVIRMVTCMIVGNASKARMCTRN